MKRWSLSVPDLETRTLCKEDFIAILVTLLLRIGEEEGGIAETDDTTISGTARPLRGELLCNQFNTGWPECADHPGADVAPGAESVTAYDFINARTSPP